jgi:hypothetical protein
MKVDTILHAITNRGGPFVSHLLPTTSEFKPEEQSDHYNEVRRILCLDVPDTDYFVRLFLGLLHAYPALVDNFNEDTSTYELGRNFSNTLQLKDATLVQSRHGYPYVRIEEAWPPDMVTKLEYYSDTEMDVTHAGQTTRTPITLMADRISPKWLLNIRGDILFNLEDTENATAVYKPGWIEFLTATPYKVNYEALAKELTLSNSTRIILSGAGLSSKAYYTDDPSEQVATIVAALGLTNKHALTWEQPR